MTQFRTDFKLPSYPFSLSHQNKILALGSCFAENIGEKLTAEKFQILRNPFGIIYNPASIAEVLRRLFHAEGLTDADVFSHGNLWHSRVHHSSFSQASKKLFLENIDEKTEQAIDFSAQIDRLALTFGTAYVWEEKTTGRINTNCHKRPQREFTRRRMSISEMTKSLLPILQKMKERQPTLEVLLTVSPVRHIRDGIIENRRSKAALHLAAEELCTETNFAHYFPAYEIMQDDLRDYRFYAADMLHPNETAAAYIYEKFRAAFFDEETQNLCEKIANIRRAFAHRPFRPDSEAHSIFKEKYRGKARELMNTHPEIDFSEELKKEE